MTHLKHIDRLVNTLLGFVIAVGVGGGSALIYRHGMESHYVAVVGAGALCGVGFLLPIMLRVKITIAACSALGAVYCVNLILAFADTSSHNEPSTRWVVSQSGEERADRALMAQALGITFDKRNRLEVLMGLRSLGIDAWPTVSPRILLREWWTHYYGAWPSEDRESLLKADGREMLPIGGIANSFTVYCNENGSYVTYVGDEHGFANPHGLWGKSAIEIAFVGDSFVHGGCVRRDENFVALTRQRYPLTLNLGNDGIGPLFQLASIKEYLVSRRPKVVVWSYFCGNDLYDMIKEQRTLLKHYLSPGFSQHLEEKQTWIDKELKGHVQKVLESRTFLAKMSEFGDIFRHPTRHAEEWGKVFKLSYVVDLTKESVLRLDSEAQRSASQVPYQPPVGEENLALFQTILEEAKKTVNAWGGELVFLYLPRYERYTNNIGGQPDRDRVLEIVRNLGINVIDMHTVFSNIDDPMELFPLRLPTHYSPAGYRLVADQVVDFLDNMDVKLTKAHPQSRLYSKRHS